MRLVVNANPGEVSDPACNLGQQLEPVAFRVGDQDTEVANRVLGKGARM
jgi:hypothetical protein